jgi:peptide/nickel transport system permease protein
LIGLLIGIVAAYYGGWMDEVLMRLTDIVLAFPGLILSMALIVVLVPTGFARLDAVMLSLTIVGWPGYARLIRGEILRVKNEDYVEAAKSVGCSDIRIITRHILPNSIYAVLIVFTLDMGTIVLAAAALSFLGLGASVGYADWGQIIALRLLVYVYHTWPLYINVRARMEPTRGCSERRIGPDIKEKVE